MNSQLRKSFLRRAFELASVLGLAVVVGVAWHYATDARRRLYEAQHTLQQLPEQASVRVQLEKDLRTHEHDVARVNELLVERRAIGDVIAAIEGVAGKSRILVQVADVTAEEQPAAAASGLLTPVRLKLSAVGQAEALLRFLFDVEHLPYILHVDRLDLTSSAVNVGESALNLPVPSVDPADALSSGRESSSASQLSTDIILMIRDVAP
jgi:hypothetical protein